ncbi:MAG TPA: hypothetical protein VF133_17375 [Terriglobales bacterium]
MVTRWLIAALLVLSMPLLRAGEVLDRLVATVNGHALLQSDWDDEIRYECLMSGRPLRDVTAEERKATLDRLIDQELLREQMRSPDFKPVTSAEVEKQLEIVKADYAREHESESWSAALARYGLTDQVAKDHLAVELNQLRLVDVHLRPLVQVDREEIETYYQEQILPKLAGGTPVTLQQARPKIREILVQQKINEQLGSWLEALHSQAQISLFDNGRADSGSK